ncbi:MAG: site-2 protease family protein [Cytophagales bacterium]|nr:MAG: site-2 protease family protein [Cytophagales bacterium]
MLSNILKKSLIHVGLFVLTLATTTMAGADWIGLHADSLWKYFQNGLWYSIPFIGILTVHEFGHYLTAKYYQLKVTLPYYIPFYFPYIPSIGTMGAFIKIKSIMHSKKIVFDVGIAGPLAGFVAAVLLLWYGFTHLPNPEYVYGIHPNYEQYGLEYDKTVYTYQHLRAEDSIYSVQKNIKFIPKNEYQIISTGSNLMFYIFEKFISNRPEWIPNKFELFHYPFLFAGFLALFFTALNLLPIGQLDGGHVLYGMIGSKWQRRIVPYIFGIFVYLATIDFLKESFELKPMASADDMLSFAPLYLLFLTLIFSGISKKFSTNLMIAVIVFSLQYFTLYFYPSFKGFEQWWVFAFLLGRFLGIYHPPSPDETPLDWKRKILGWSSLIIFILCFSPQPIIIEYVSR